MQDFDDSYIWARMFPDVSFRDKVCIEWDDGTIVVHKHLYYCEEVLHSIDWSTVAKCYEVQLIYIAYYEVVGSIKLTPKQKGSMLMYKVIFDGNVMVCQDLEDATETAMHLRNAEYSLVEVVPAEPTDLDSFIEVEV